MCPEDLAVSGIILTESHIENALTTLHSSHSDAIGAPKVCSLSSSVFKIISARSV